MRTNWGKVGTNGCWKITEFESAEQCEQEAPFGSDEGNDTLCELQDYCQEEQDKAKFAEFPQLMMEKIWEIPYLPSVHGQSDSE